MEPLNSYLIQEVRAAYEEMEALRSDIGRYILQGVETQVELDALQQQLNNERHQHITLQVYCRHLEAMLLARPRPGSISPVSTIISETEMEELSEPESEGF